MEQIKHALETGLKIPFYSVLYKRLILLKVTKVWLTRIHSKVLQQALKNLSHAVNAYLSKRKIHSGFRKFKKKGYWASFRYPQYIRCENGQIFLPKIGLVTYRNSCSREGVIKQAIVTCQENRWYVTIVREVDIDVPDSNVLRDSVPEDST